MVKTVSESTQPEQSEPSEQARGLKNDPVEQRCKDLSQVELKMSIVFVEQITRLSSKRKSTPFLQSM